MTAYSNIIIKTIKTITNSIITTVAVAVITAYSKLIIKTIKRTTTLHNLQTTLKTRKNANKKKSKITI